MKLRLATLISIVLAATLSVSAQYTGTVNQNYSHLEIEGVDKAQRTVPDSLVKLDANGDRMAQIIIESPLDGLVFENGGVYKENGKTSHTKVKRGSQYQYTVNFLQGYDRMDVKHPEYVGTTIILKAKSQPGEIWRVKVMPVDAAEIETAQVDNSDFRRRVRLKTDNFSKVYVDEELLVERNSPKNYEVRLEEGKHYIHSQYGNGKAYRQSIDVKKDGQEVDIRYGGEVTIKNGKDVSITSHASPQADLLNHKGNTWEYDNLYGEYTLRAKPTGIKIGSVTKTFNMSMRGKKTFYIDEMIPYVFLLYHGSVAQPLGLSFGFCQRWGFMVSYHTNIKTKINTIFGEAELINHADPDKSGSYATQWTITGGPIWRFYRKFYLKIEGGGVNYISTSNPKILDPGFKKKWGASVSAELMWRFGNFMIGAGYMQQFVDKPFDPNIGQQFTFSAGFAM